MKNDIIFLMPKEILFSNKNINIKKDFYYYTASILRILLMFSTPFVAIYSFFSLFPANEFSISENRKVGLQLHWIFGSSFIFSVGLAIYLITIYLSKNKSKSALLSTLIPISNFILLLYIWSLLKS